MGGSVKEWGGQQQKMHTLQKKREILLFPRRLLLFGMHKVKRGRRGKLPPSPPSPEKNKVGTTYEYLQKGRRKITFFPFEKEYLEVVSAGTTANSSFYQN